MSGLMIVDPADRFDLAYLHADGERERINILACVAHDIRARCAMVHIGDIQFLCKKLSMYHFPSPRRVRAEVVIDFPDGAGGVMTKLRQAETASTFGADGADIVINLRQVQDRDRISLIAELRSVLNMLPESKAIIQLPYLWQYHKDAIPWVLDLLAEARVTCVKDWTTRSDNFSQPVQVDDDTRLRYLEFVSGYITKHDLPLLKKIAGKVTAANAQKFIDAGADLLGISYGKATEIREALLQKK